MATSLLSQIPFDLGFDRQKFPYFREFQFESAQQVVDSNKPLVLAEAPTGSGKSLLGMASHALMDRPRSAYLVSTKQLQDQIESDFQVPVVKGRNNYPCLHFNDLFPDVTSEICAEYLHGEECEFGSDCPYLTQKRKALSSPMCVLNYPLFFSEANYVGGFSNLSYLILDEVDTVEDHLMSFVEVSITPYLMKRVSIGPPEFKTKLESWVKWVADITSRVMREIDKLGPAENLSPVKLKDLISLRRIYRKLEFLSGNLDEGWVMEHDDSGKSSGPIIFKPVRIGSFAPHNLWSHTQKSLGMSATIMGHQAMAMELGLHSWDADFISLPSPFPVENRRVEYIPVANITHKTKDSEYPKLGNAIEKVLNKHQDEKILIHAVSYDLRNFLMDYLRPQRHGLMSHDKKDRAQALERFKGYNQPIAFISPSMERGIDLPGDLCRVIIVAKVPYPSLGSPQVNKRLHGFSDGSLWYARRTARTLVQMCGRATRSQEDYSVSYILDSQFGQLVSRHGSLFPDWWRESVRSGSL